MFTVRIVKNENILEKYQDLKANYLCAGDEYKVYAVNDDKFFLINRGGTSWKWISSDVCEPVS